MFRRKLKLILFSFLSLELTAKHYIGLLLDLYNRNSVTDYPVYKMGKFSTHQQPASEFFLFAAGNRGYLLLLSSRPTVVQDFAC